MVQDANIVQYQYNSYTQSSKKQKTAFFFFVINMPGMVLPEYGIPLLIPGTVAYYLLQAYHAYEILIPNAAYTDV